MDILKTAWGDLLNENEKLAALLDEKDAEIERLEALLHGTGANRYWEGRWRDEVARIWRLEAVLRGLVEAYKERQCGDLELTPTELMWLADASRALAGKEGT